MEPELGLTRDEKRRRYQRDWMRAFMRARTARRAADPVERERMRTEWREAQQRRAANPISRAHASGTSLTPLAIGYTVAEGLAAGNPGRKGEWVLRWLRDDGGLAADAEDADILAAQRRLARSEGIWAGPTGATPLAVLIKLLAEKRIDPDQRFAVIVTETGLKTEAPSPAREASAYDYASLRRLVEERLALPTVSP